MKRLTRRILFASFIVANGLVAARPAHAAQDLNVDNLGGIIVVWCDGCWFWNCNCP